jgi:tRNA(fMet)-specific endonuclease VapC
VYLLDTNTFIYFFKGQGLIADRLLATPPKEIGLSAVVLYELETGIAKSQHPTKRKRQLESLINSIVLIPFSEREAKASAQLRSKLETAGNPIGTLDTLIAGTALAHGAILVTRNLREFARIGELRVENWYT